jgi:hypothetical protein
MKQVHRRCRRRLTTTDYDYDAPSVGWADAESHESGSPKRSADARRALQSNLAQGKAITVQ